MDVAIIGAGLAGLACATRLAEAGHRPRLFDKSRGAGGRMATRRVELAGAPVTFDHGAQYFTVRDPRFAARVAQWARMGLAARWLAAGPDAWVGTPAMNAPAKELARRLDIEWNRRVERLRRERHWQVNGAGSFDAAVVALPAEQAGALLAETAPAFAAHAATVPTLPCWTLMVAFDESLPVVHDVLRGGDDAALAWAARDSAKPGRAPGERWVVQAGPQWSRRHLEDDAGSVAEHLLMALGERTGAALPVARYRTAHRWRFARTTADRPAMLWDDAAQLGVCGDWRRGARVESAWLSGEALAETILGQRGQLP